VTTGDYNPLNLTGKRVLVTGASSGIGRATCIAIASLGASVILVGRRVEALQAVRSELAGAGHAVEPFDLAADLDGIPGWLKGVTSRAGGPLNGLVHSAGVSKSTPIRAMNSANIGDIMTINLSAALMLLRGGSARGVGAEGASFVLMASVAGVAATPGLGTYSASKGALIAAARSAAQELGPKKMRVNCVAPGYVETPMLSAAQDELPTDFGILEKRHFLGFAKAEEVAVAIAYLLSDAARVVTGTTLVIDSGYST
jgi:NAD(P)-dependent dehydrogenase (short-subunit alcohol dehydrogenase family)